MLFWVSLVRTSNTYATFIHAYLTFFSLCFWFDWIDLLYSCKVNLNIKINKIIRPLLHLLRSTLFLPKNRSSSPPQTHHSLLFLASFHIMVICRKLDARRPSSAYYLACECTCLNNFTILLNVKRVATLMYVLICRRGSDRTACGCCGSARNSCCRGAACRRGVGLCCVQQNTVPSKKMAKEAEIRYWRISSPAQGNGWVGTHTSSSPHSTPPSTYCQQYR